MNRLAPSILSADFARLGEEVQKVQAAGADLIHFDVDRLDLILAMSVNPGFGGQAFIPHALDKITAIRRRIDRHVAAGGRPILLEVDGGVKVDNIRAAADAGADTFVAGSAVFGARDADGGYRGIIGRMRQAIDDAPAEERAA